MIEINVCRIQDGATVRSALAKAIGLADTAVLPTDEYWSLETFAGKVGFEFVPDDEWGLLVVHTTDEAIEDAAVRISLNLAQALNTKCAVFDPEASEENGLWILYPDGKKVAGQFQQIANQTRILPLTDTG